MAPQHRGFKGAGQAARVGLQWRAMAGIARGTVVIERVESQALKGNPLGDPHVREVPVYLPPGYENGQERYPVIYVLAGFGGFGRALLNRRGFSEALDERLDRLIAQAKMTERSRSPPFGP